MQPLGLHFGSENRSKISILFEEGIQALSHQLFHDITSLISFMRTFCFLLWPHRPFWRDSVQATCHTYLSMEVRHMGWEGYGVWHKPIKLHIISYLLIAFCNWNVSENLILQSLSRGHSFHSPSIGAKKPIRLVDKDAFLILRRNNDGILFICEEISRNPYPRGSLHPTRSLPPEAHSTEF